MGDGPTLVQRYSVEYPNIFAILNSGRSMFYKMYKKDKLSTDDIIYVVA
jgi:hypothetical protein